MELIRHTGSKKMCRNVRLLGFTITLAFISSAQAGLVYSALHPNQANYWHIYFQANLTASPQLVAPEISGDQSAPRLSPNGQQVAFEVQGKGIYICSLDLPTACQEIAPVQSVRPVWRSQTNHLLLVRYLIDESNEDADIFTTQESLTITQRLIQQTGIQDYPHVSPTGHSLVYTSSQTIAPYHGGVQVVQQLWVMNLVTGMAHQLILSSAQDTHPHWSPSGKRIAFASNRTGQFEIWVTSAEGHDLQQITSGAGTKTWPTWSPDEQTILFTLTQEGHQNLWLINTDGTQLRPFQPFGSTIEIPLRDADWQGEF